MGFSEGKTKLLVYLHNDDEEGDEGEDAGHDVDHCSLYHQLSEAVILPVIS